MFPKDQGNTINVTGIFYCVLCWHSHQTCSASIPLPILQLVRKIQACPKHQGASSQLSYRFSLSSSILWILWAKHEKKEPTTCFIVCVHSSYCKGFEDRIVSLACRGSSLWGAEGPLNYIIKLWSSESQSLIYHLAKNNLTWVNTCNFSVRSDAIVVTTSSGQWHSSFPCCLDIQCRDSSSHRPRHTGVEAKRLSVGKQAKWKLKCKPSEIHNPYVLKIHFIPCDLFYSVTCEELEWERMLTDIDITNLNNLRLAAVSLLLNHRAVIARLDTVNIAVALQLICVSALIYKLQWKNLDGWINLNMNSLDLTSKIRFCVNNQSINVYASVTGMLLRRHLTPSGIFSNGCILYQSQLWPLQTKT